MCQPDQAPPFYKHPNEPMRSLLLSCLLLLFGAVSAHAQSATTFQLPPEPDATSRPQAQGPVDLEGETRTAPRIIVKPTASPSATPTAQPSPRASATPATRPTPQPTRSSSEGPNLPSTDRSVSTQDLLTETPTRSMTRESRSDGESAQDSAANAQEEIDETSPVGPLSPSVATSADLTSADSPSAGLASDDAADLPAAPEDSQQPDWMWVAPWLAALIALAIAAIVLLRQRRKRAMRVPAPEVEMAAMPLRKVDKPVSPAQPAAGSLEVQADAVTLSRSVMNATISYRLTILNRGREPITQIQIGGDITTAHGRVPAAQQLADTDQEFPELHSLDRLEPGERSTVRGEVRLPLREVRALRQGNVPVFVPLLRLTVRAANIEPRAYTYVIGSKPAQTGARPSPFRLDEPPRSYAQLTTRAIA